MYHTPALTTFENEGGDHRRPSRWGTHSHLDSAQAGQLWATMRSVHQLRRFPRRWECHVQTKQPPGHRWGPFRYTLSSIKFRLKHWKVYTGISKDLAPQILLLQHINESIREARQLTKKDFFSRNLFLWPRMSISSQWNVIWSTPWSCTFERTRWLHRAHFYMNHCSLSHVLP